MFCIQITLKKALNNQFFQLLEIVWNYYANLVKKDSTKLFLDKNFLKVKQMFKGYWNSELMICYS